MVYIGSAVYIGSVVSIGVVGLETSTVGLAFVVIAAVGLVVESCNVSLGVFTHPFATVSVTAVTTAMAAIKAASEFFFTTL